MQGWIGQGAIMGRTVLLQQLECGGVVSLVHEALEQVASAVLQLLGPRLLLHQ